MIKKKTKQKINAKILEMNMNLENNYKDLAKTALKELDQMVEELRAEGELNDKDYSKIRHEVDSYKSNLENYHH